MLDSAVDGAQGPVTLAKDAHRPEPRILWTLVSVVGF